VPVLAADISSLLALAIGIMGLGGVVFTALRFRRDDTTAIVTQQDTILRDMKSLNEELRTTTDRLRVERDALAGEVEKLTVQVRELNMRLDSAV
jgi:hypothetical protein